ncbi:MAG: DMT family transporter [Candidatus Hodarchaeota archaeon]
MSKIDFNFISKSSIIVLLWSTPPLVSKLWVGTKEAFPGLFFGFLRYSFGFTALIFIILFHQGNFNSLKVILRKQPKTIIFCAMWLVLMIIGQNFSVSFILGSSSSVLLNFNPCIIYLFAPILFTDESYTKNKTIGFIISSIGILIVFLASLEATSLFNFFIGNFLGFLSGIAWAGYSLTLKLYFQEKGSEEVTALNLLSAAFILFLLSLVMEHHPPVESFTLESIWGLIIIGFGAAAIAFTLYLQLVQKYGSIKAGNIQFLIPLVSLLIAWILLGEYSFLTLIGGIFCAVGVALVNYGFNNESKNTL